MLAEHAREAAAPPRSAEDWDQKEMSFTEHLAELRNRLMVSLGTIVGISIVLLWPSQFMIRWLRDEYLPPGTTLHAFAPTDVIFAMFKFSIYGALVIGLPVVVFQAWMFIVPAFHPKTRRIVYRYTWPSIFLAAAGLAFCHFFIIRRVIAGLTAITNAVATETYGIEPTLNLILLTFVAFALIFQTPMVLVALARIGVVSVDMLRRSRRYAIMGILVLSGIAAPDGSPITMMLLAVPMFLLYEVSIVIIVVLEKSWRRETARA